jgi:hypothetical protein
LDDKPPSTKGKPTMHDRDDDLLVTTREVDELKTITFLLKGLYGRLKQEQEAKEEAFEEKETVSYERKKPKRKPLPKDLAREEIIHDIDDKDKVCDCGCEKKKIGEEVSEQLEVIPASIKVVAHIRPKYACNRCDSAVAIAPMPVIIKNQFFVRSCTTINPYIAF